MQTLKDTYPNAEIVFLTPARRETMWEPSAANNRPLIDYVKVIEDTAAKYGIHVLNLYDKLGIDPTEAADREVYVPDGLHFNDAGHAVLAEVVDAFIRTI